MPAQILNTQFIDTFGNSRTSYRSNSSDRQAVEFIIEDVIEMVSSQQNALTIDRLDNTITSTTENWIDKGFRVGQTITIDRIDASGVPTGTTLTRTVLALSAFTLTILDFDSSYVDGEQYTVGDRLLVTSEDYHDGMDLQFNHSLNGTPGNTASLIDGENTTLRFTGLNALSVSDDMIAVQVGNKSGSFACSSQITRISDSGNSRRYTVLLNIINSGSFNPDWFIGNSCLKLYAVMKLQVIVDETFGTFNLVYDEAADTGYFNEPYNLGVSNSGLVQGIPVLDYYNGTGLQEFTIQTDDPSELEIGGVYIPTDDSYYKNKPYSQSSLCMRMITDAGITLPVYFSDANPDGAKWTFNISTPTIVGDQYTYTFSFIPNTEFQEFMESRDEGDRHFVLYFRAGTKNITLFDGQLTKEPLPAGVIPDIDTAYYLNHSENVDDANGIDLSGGGLAYVEDDLGFVFKFQVLRNSFYNNFKASIRAFNIVNQQTFILQETAFDMSTAQISGDGKQLVSLSVNQPNNLPSTSAKKVATFGLEESLDTMTKYGLKLYYPFIIDWRYWQNLSNVSSDFYTISPDNNHGQNKDWMHYILNPDWIITLYLTIETELQLFEKSYLLPFNDYETGNTEPTINLYRENGDQVESIVDGEIMTIEAIDETATAINIDTVWAPIVIEPTESNPRWLISNIVGNGNDINNPLSDFTMEVSGLQTIRRCKLDTNKLNLQNNASIGIRIFGTDEFGSFLLQENLYYLLQENSSKIIIE